MNPNRRTYSLPAKYESAIEAELAKLGFRLTEAKRLSDAVLKLSDYYTQNPDGATPWKETWAQAASLVYYFPLNYARNYSVAREAKRLGFFEGLEKVFDFGSGTGSSLFAFLDLWPGNPPIDVSASDISEAALDLGALLDHNRSVPKKKIPLRLGEKPSDWRDEKNTLLLSSYAATELESIPKWWLDAEALMILEPSTQEDSRKLMRFRDELVALGHEVWAPCTHFENCPLLHNSERDWCHDRIHWQAPAWFTEIEKYLPMKNRTLTFSYVLARKRLKRPIALAGLARLVGDTLIEKGKTRQAVCRNHEKEFLAWFPQRMDDEIELERGSLIKLKPDLPKKSSEVRLNDAESVFEIPPEQKM